MTPERKRLDENKESGVAPWQKWGPYVAELCWGTVREDYSLDGNAWNYLPFEKSHKISTGAISIRCAFFSCPINGNIPGLRHGIWRFTASLSLIDPDAAKEQLWLLLFDQFQHPNGQIPSYEWEFSDLNPLFKHGPRFTFTIKREKKSAFAWWVNKVDSSGDNIFEGGVLGMDNISILDRSSLSMNITTPKQGKGWGRLIRQGGALL